MSSRQVLATSFTWLCCISLVEAQPATLDSLQIVDQIIRLIDEGGTYRSGGEYNKAHLSYDSALVMSQEFSDSTWYAKSLGELGIVRMYQGRYSDALKLLHNGLLFQESLNDSVGVAKSLNLIASVHHALSDFDIAGEYYRKSLLIREKLPDQRDLGISYNNMGSLREDEGKYEEALLFHNKSMGIWKATRDTSWIAVSLRHIGFCHFKQGELDLALKDYLLSLKLNEKLGKEWNIVKVTIGISDIYLQKGQFDRALVYCKRAYRLSEKKKNLFGIEESCRCLSEAYEKTGESDLALDYYRKYIAARDSIFGHQRVKELTKLELDFVFQREQLADSLQFVKEKELTDARIQKQRIGLFSTGMVILMILILALTIYRGKRRPEHLLLNILPSEIAEELKDHGSAKARRLENVTVLFTDFKGFTAIAEKLSPEQLVAEIHTCFSAFDAIMEKYGVEKIKTIGDAYMAAGGVPVANSTHAVDVVNAALEMQAFMKEQAIEKKKEGGAYFEMRVGVNTGPVVAGIVGTKKFQYDVWGDTVNLGSRMESSGKVGKVNISQSTYELIKDRFDCEYRGEIEAKGKGKVKMYFVGG